MELEAKPSRGTIKAAHVMVAAVDGAQGGAGNDKACGEECGGDPEGNHELLEEAGGCLGLFGIPCAVVAMFVCARLLVYLIRSIKDMFDQHTGSLPIYGEASAKSKLYKDRSLLLYQRLSRDQHFMKPAFETETTDYGGREISPTQSLVGQTGWRRCVMGVISQLEDGHFYLDDLTVSVEINLSDAISFSDDYKITTGFFTENTIAVAEGQILLEGIFKIFTCGFPPLED
ncbi:hypothetical protein NL676_022037 [Syzygium grande]|nr:hypothetical protein NL676_022037 [Syzygium grande]